MNKKMRDLVSLIEEKTAEAAVFMKDENKDVAKATKLLDEVDELRKEFEVQKRLFEATASAGADEAAPQAAPADHGDAKADEKDPTLLAKQIRAAVKPEKYATKALSATVDEDGSYTVPEDDLTQINHFKEADGSVLPYIDVVNVATKSGSRVFQTRGQASALAEMTDSLSDALTTATTNSGHQIPNPKFTTIQYNIKKYAGFMPVPQDLVDDSDANIMGVVTDWLHKAQMHTDNDKVFGLLGATGTGALGTGYKAIKSLDDIKKAIISDLEDFGADVMIYTNSDGIAWLDTLKDSNGRPLLNPVPNEPARLQLTVGFNTVRVVKFPNRVLASGTNKIPFLIGNMRDAVIKFDRKNLTLDASKVAAIGGLNAFAKDLTLVRAISRADYVIKDATAIYKGYIDTSASA